MSNHLSSESSSNRETPSKKALVILAHGSRNPNAIQEINDLASPLTASAQSLGFECVKVAFLELTEPKLPHVVEELIADRYLQVTVMPYFLASGNHVERDIPELVAALNERFQAESARIELMNYFGSNQQITQWIVAHLESEA